MRVTRLFLASLLLALGISGCGEYDVNKYQPPAKSEAGSGDTPTENDNPADKPADTSQASDEDGSREEATSGVGAKGRDYGDGISAVTVPVQTFFSTRQRLVFTVSIPHAMNLYKAQDADSRGPSTHEQFMQRIIGDNNIALPELPEGDVYEYDPKTETLMVRHPK